MAFNVRGQDPATVLSSVVTFHALLLTGAVLTWVELIGEPIECWCPAETTDAMCNFTKSLCWVSKQFVIHHDDAIPQDQGLREEVQKREMQFYPLVPFILLLLAAVLRLPSFLWEALQGEEGLNIRKAVQLAMNPDQDDEEIGENIAFEMDFNLTKNEAARAGHPGWVSVKKAVSVLGVFPLGSDVGTYQTGLFLCSRLLSLVVVVLSFPALGLFLHMDYTSWGAELIRAVVWDDEVPEMYAFPQETLCDFRVRQMQNVHVYTVQCVLPINMYNEKVFVALWFCLLGLLLANLYSYQYWLRKLLVPANRRALVAKHLAILSPDINRTRRADISRFALSYLSHDSVLVLRFLENAAGDRLANVVLTRLWNQYNCSPAYVFQADNNPDTLYDSNPDILYQ
ncbi:innexin unc-7-like [Babylonia areolata]|uniref:innexin unc-7-like n=1 Tax=Babylonia areolata TaxID=304850 RepID=UPI003FD45C0F